MPGQLSLLDDNVHDTKQAAQTSLDAVGGAIDALELVSSKGTDLMKGDAGNDTLVATGVNYDPTDPSTIGHKLFVAGAGNDLFIGTMRNSRPIWDTAEQLYRP
ncbi:hypothetical protein [Antarctobacter sp.]|uniref:hypothetical protein n=1 Tax=Antarctobacter sp. TaxID=1872577 RepID=UPI002B268E31|nr:hypothetical protein [Antarctobacter sp.]